MWLISGWLNAGLVRDTIALKREQRATAITDGLALAKPVPAAEDAVYLLADATTIAANVRNKKWTARRVMEAYVRSAARAHSRTNCLTEVMFMNGLQRAEELDRLIAEGATSEELDKKLLLGVPVSIKDQIDYVGVDTSRGFVRCVTNDDGNLQ